MKPTALLDHLDGKLARYAACEQVYELRDMAQALVAFADHPSRHGPSHARTFTYAFGEQLPPELVGVELRFERCQEAVRARFAREPATGRKALFEEAVNGLAFGVQQPARRLLAQLVGISKQDLRGPKRPSGPPTTLTVSYPVSVIVETTSGRGRDRRQSLSSAALAAFDGVGPDGESCVDGAPALGDIPGRTTTALVLRHDASTKSLRCDLVMTLERPLGDDELATLRDTWLPEFGAGFELYDWATPVAPPRGRYVVDVSFEEAPMSITQHPLAPPDRAKRSTPKRATSKRATPKRATPKRATLSKTRKRT